MKHGIGSAAALIVPFVLVGCGSKDPDTLYKQQVQCLNELAEAVDNNSSQEAVDQITKRYKQNYDSLVQLKLDEDKYNRLNKKYQTEIMKYMNVREKVKAKHLPILLPDTPPFPIPGK
jgi:hypothetical protein